MLIAPAFAADPQPTYRDSPGEYTEVVAYNSNVATPSTEVLIDTEFHYLDYTPEIDITYSWDENLEWTYIKNGNEGAWVKGGSLKEIEDNINFATFGHVTESTLLDMITKEENWESIIVWLGSFDSNVRVCHLIKFENNASSPVEVSLEEQATTLATKVSSSITKPEAVIGGTTASKYLDYRFMKPDTTDLPSTVTPVTVTSISATFTVGTVADDTSISYGNSNYNKAIVAISPKTTFKPTDYAPWIAENGEFNKTAGAPVEARLKLIFTKAD